MKIYHNSSIAVFVFDDYDEIKKIFPAIEDVESGNTYSFSKSDIKRVKAKLSVLEISPEIKTWLKDNDPRSGSSFKWEWITWINMDEYIIDYRCQITINDPKLASLFRLIWL